MTVAYGKGPRGKATRLHAELVRSRGRCEHCGGHDALQCAHIIPRRYAATRTDETNAFCLCAACHRRFTEWPLEFASFVLEQIGVTRYEQLKEKARVGVKANEPFWLGECERLQALIKAAA